MPVEIKTIGASGQISLGKQFAGKIVTVNQVEEGVWTIKTAKVIPDNEMWLHTPQMNADLNEALAWSNAHPRRQTNLKTIARKLKGK